MARKKKIGVGATCSVLTRFLHPRPEIVRKYPNAKFADRLGGLIAQSMEVRKLNHKDQTVIVFRHNDFPNLMVYSQKRYAKVLQCGAAADYFEGSAEEVVLEDVVDEEESLVETPQIDNANLIVPIIENSDTVNETISRMINDGYEVDDDNDPAPENVPTPSTSTTSQQEITYFPWGSRSNCERRSQGHRFENANLVTPTVTSRCIDYFLKFLPEFIKQTILVETNKVIDGRHVTWGEFMRYLGIWFLLSILSHGCSRRSFWEDTEPSEFCGAPFRFNKYMSYTRFEAITSALRYTNAPAPDYPDKFYEVRDMINAWNEHMKTIFIPGWMSCLDESMSSWTRRWTCPGFMYVPRKPHPMGNEYHSICCGCSGIMFAIELVEGKDKPPEVNPQYHNKGKTAGLLLRLCKGIFGTGKVVILDSGFCVLKAIIELKKMGIYASAMIKKRRYWPKYVKGEDIKEHMSSKDVGTCERLPGILDGEKFDLYALKEPDYVMMMMSTYGSLIVKDMQRDCIRMDKDRKEIARFKYTEVVGNHFTYRGAVDDHNGKRHDCGTKNGLCLEDSWITNRWENKVFAFILGITEVNAYLGMKYFSYQEYTQLEFRKKLAYELLNNTYDDVDGLESQMELNRRNMRSMNQHVLITAPAFSNFVRGKWEKKYKTMYQQHVCSTPNCKRRIRTVCSCDRSLWMCTQCFTNHCIECNIGNLVNS